MAMDEIVDIKSSSLTEFPQYESSIENSESYETELNSLEISSNGSKEESGGKMCDLGDRNDVIANHLDELKSSGLEALFRNAINRIDAGGYAAYMVENVISRKGLYKYIGEGDPWTNIQNATRNVLEGKNVVGLEDIDSENFRHLSQCTMADLIDELREIRPSLTISQAMWLLLLYDLNISMACETKQDRLNSLIHKEEHACNSSKLQLELQCNSPNFKNDSCSSPNSSNDVYLEVESDFDSLSLVSEESASPREESAQAKFQPSVSKEKSEPSFEQQNPKETTPLGRKGNLKIEKLENIGAGVLHYCVGIPYDKSLGKYTPQDKADKQILELVPRLQSLQEQLKHLKEAGARRVMEVARRLKQDKQEMDILKKEMEETIEYMKEKKIFEKNAKKKIVEMENAVANVQIEIENTRSAAHLLEMQNSMLKNELDAARLLSTKLIISHEKTMERENITLTEEESCKAQLCLLEYELEKEKQQLASLQLEVDKQRSLQDKIEAKVEQHMAEREKLLAEVEATRKENELLKKCVENEENMIREELAMNLQIYEEDIAKLERELAELKLNSKSIRIVGFSKIDKAKGKMAIGGLMHYRECVICLKEGISMVFLPCAHQIVCAHCNELLKNQRMEDYPSCRAPVQMRIRAIFA